MRKIKMGIAMFAVLLGSVAAFAGRIHKKDTLQQYKNIGSESATVWALNSRAEGADPGDYLCTESENVCTAFFSSPPANGTPAPDDPSTEPGQYTEIN